jgi:hypothetical protein
MSDPNLDGNPELVDIGNALDGTLNISTEDVEEIPSARKPFLAPQL